MATGKQAKDIFKRTSIPADIGREVTPRIKGRPKTEEPYQKVTVCLFDRQSIWLDQMSLNIRGKTGKNFSRAELIRILVDRAREDEAGFLKLVTAGG